MRAGEEADEIHTYRITLEFRANALTVRVLRWAVDLYSHKDAPRDLRLRIERVR